jgi:hypothetical protein
MRNETLEGAAVLVRGKALFAERARDDRRQVVGGEGCGGQLGTVAGELLRRAGPDNASAGVNHDLAAADQEHYGDRINRLLEWPGVQPALRKTRRWDG